MSRILFLGLGCLLPSTVWAGGGQLPAAEMSLWWTLPFIGMLLSLTLIPLFSFSFWEHHHGKVSGGLAFVTLVALIFAFGETSVQSAALETLLHHYTPFLIMITALYTIAGGLEIRLKAPATPLMNTLLLAAGTGLAGWIGTTGAAMLCIRPLLHMNTQRKFRVHHMVFLIFLVANIGGAVTPLGDPPLFLGFLNGVNFFWTLENLFLETALLSGALLLVFYGLDTFFAWREGSVLVEGWPKVTVRGRRNIWLLLGVIGLVLLSGLWRSEIKVSVLGIPLELPSLVRDGGLILLSLVSYVITPAGIHKANHFSWEPLKEVAKIFLGIFITAIPVITILTAGKEGALAPLVNLVTQGGVPQNAIYFWLTGTLSSLLDNAPTYLVFFYVAGGNAEQLMTQLAPTLSAISLGAVFMGAMTYVGNAPNFMIKTIAESHKIKMPSFFGYMVWSLALLLPLLALLAWIKF